MRIGDRRQKTRASSVRKKTGADRLRRVENVEKESFSELLRNEQHADLQVLLQEVMTLGDELADHRSTRTLEAYKNAVKRFVAYTTSKGFKVQRKTKRRNDTDYIIKTVDKALADLTEVVLARETPRIDVLSRLEMIQGLLVDCLR